MNANFSFDNAGVFSGLTVTIWVIGTAILWFIVNVSFALAVLNDSHQLARHLHRRTFFVGGGMWALATLLGGVFVAGVYWVIHHSTLRPQPLSTATETNPTNSQP